MKLKKIILLFLMCVILSSYSMEFFRGIFFRFSQETLNKKLYEAVLENQIGKVDDLIKHGADVDYFFILSMTLLMGASLWKQKDMAGLLLARGARSNLYIRRGRTALMYAAISADVEIAQMLIQNGAVLNITSERGGTALSIAVWRKQIEMIQFLLNQMSKILKIAACFEMTDVMSDEVKERIKNIDFTEIENIGMLYEMLNHQIQDTLDRIHLEDSGSIEILQVFHEFILRHEEKLPGLRKKIERLIRLAIKYGEESFKKHAKYIRG